VNLEGILTYIPTKQDSKFQQSGEQEHGSLNQD